MSQAKDLRIEFKFRNAALLARLQERFGAEASVKTMAVGTGVHYGELCYLLSLSRSPFMVPGDKRGTEVEGIRYTRAAMKLANFFFVEPAVLFPVSLYSIKFPKKYYKDFESIQLLSFQEAAEQKLLPPVESYEENYEALGLKERMGQLLETLTAREEKIIRLRFGLDGTGVEKTYEEIGEAFKVSKTRVQQIEHKALRRLRHPARSKTIKAFYTGEEPAPPEPVEFAINPVVERIQNRIREKVKPEVKKAVLVRVQAMEPLLMEKPADPEADPDFTALMKEPKPKPMSEKRHKALVAKLTRLKSIKEHSEKPGAKWVHAYDRVLGEFRLLPFSLIQEDYYG